jgi:hypothetical protein
MLAVDVRDPCRGALMEQFWFGGILGIFAGFVVGHLTARAQRARSDLSKTKEMVPDLRKMFRELMVKTLGRWLLIGAVVLAVGYIALRGPD